MLQTGTQLQKSRERSSLRETPCITSEQLLGGTREVIIQHGGEQYRLRVTSAGKLILTK